MIKRVESAVAEMLHRDRHLLPNSNIPTPAVLLLHVAQIGAFLRLAGRQNGVYRRSCMYSSLARPASDASNEHDCCTARGELLQLRGGAKDFGTDGGCNLDLDSRGRLKLLDGDGPIILDGLKPSVWSATRPRTPRTSNGNSLFLHMKHSVEKAEHITPLGNLVSCHRLLACSRVTRYWMGPAFGTSANDVPLDTQFLLVEVSNGGPYVLMLPLVDESFRASLHSGGGNDGLVCHAESGDESVLSSKMRALYVTAGDDPYQLVKTGFAQLAEETETFSTLNEKRLPPSVDEFGWCTWDAFYSDVSPEGVIDGVISLRDAGVPPRTLILDNGWQQVTPSPVKKVTDKENDSTVSTTGLISRTANRILAVLSQVVEAFYEKFVRKAKHGSIPNRIWCFLSKTVLKGQLWQGPGCGRQLSHFLPNKKFQTANEEGIGRLKDLVSRLKNELDVKQVYCWHALHGYWRGISTDLGEKAGINASDVVPHPSNHILQLEPQIAWDLVSLFGVGLVTSESDLATFYQSLHSPLVEAGVDGVKVDVQSGVPAAGGGVGGGPHLARIYTEAMETSVSDRFSSADGAANCINCMCHSTENLYHYKVTSVARVSDDFYPRRPNSHSVHLVNVAYNSLFMGEICLPDWDMFHSKHESGPLHAAARAVGGCPVYVSDAPGQHDAELLKRLVMPDGSVLRAKLPGRPTRDCLFADVGKDRASALKVWNQNSFGGVLGAFHVQGVAWNFRTHENEVVDPAPKPLTVNVKAHDVETLRGIAGPFVAWRHRMCMLDYLPNGESLTEVQLNHRDWEIFTVVPVQISDNGVAWAPVGLADMMNSGGALLDSGRLEQGPSSPTTTCVTFTSRGPGRFVAYCQPAPSQLFIDYDDGQSVGSLPFSHDESTGLLDFVLPSEKRGPHQVKVLWE